MHSNKDTVVEHNKSNAIQVLTMSEIQQLATQANPLESPVQIIHIVKLIHGLSYSTDLTVVIIFKRKMMTWKQVLSSAV